MIGFIACFALIGACASFTPSGPPKDEDVSNLEMERVLEPYVSSARDGSRFVEFAPSVETRSITCIAEGNAFLCSYESRTKSYFRGTWDVWQARTMRVTWDAGSGCWVANQA
jgi:hypothetical protein